MIKLLFGRRSTWAPQRRADYRLSWTQAARVLWPQTAVGFVLAIMLAITAPIALPWFLPFLGGLVLAIPFAVLMSSPPLAAWIGRRYLSAMPEEIAPPPELVALRRHPGDWA